MCCKFTCFFLENFVKILAHHLVDAQKNLKAVGPNPIILYFPDPIALQYLRTLQLTLGDIFSEFMPAERTEQMEWTDTLKSHLLKEGMTTPTVIQVSFQSYEKLFIFDPLSKCPNNRYSPKSVSMSLKVVGNMKGGGGGGQEGGK
jgi:hypothetical protein